MRESHKMLGISTGHLTSSTREALAKDSIDAVVCYPKATYGFFICLNEGTVNDPMNPDCPDDLRDVIQFAVNEGYDWIMFDCDAEVYNELPVYSD